MSLSNVHFLGDEKIDGISLVENPFTAAKLRARLRTFAHAPYQVLGFPVNCHFQLSMDNIHNLKIESYVVSPKPEGIRCLLYIDSEGEMFMENIKLDIFKLDKECAPNLSAKNTVLDGFLTRKFVRNPVTQNDQQFEGNLVFVIMNTTRVNGVDLTEENIFDRISTVKREVIVPRLDGIKRGMIDTDQEVFRLEIEEYVDASVFEECYLSQQFKDDYEYPLRSFVLQPLNGSYICGNSESIFPKIFQWDESNIQEFSFRLKIADKKSETGDLYAMGRLKKGLDLNLSGPWIGSQREEVKHATIKLTEEMRYMDGSIIVCRYVDHQWVFVRLRNDSDLPNGKNALEGKLRALKNPVTRHHLLDALLG